MGISSTFKAKIDTFTQDEKDRLVRMGWEDRTPFDAIEEQFGLTQNDFIRFMRTELEENAYRRWRKRANQHGHLKHAKKRSPEVSRFKCTRQTTEGKTKGWK
jgi:uncharacterized protein (TIGR03643 family)